MTVRLLLTPALPGADNMALDVALMQRARVSGETVLRVYAWAAPTLSLGRNQAARGRYDEARAAREGVAIVRRPTGGRAVLHDREVTYSLTAPARDAEGVRAVYARINALLVDGLRRLGVPATLAEPAGRLPIPGDAPCFEAPAAGEVVAGGRKLVGSAQWRHEGALLQHGSILVADDQARACALLRAPVAVPPAPATLASLLGRVPTLEEVAAALFAAARAVSPDAAPLAMDAVLLAAAGAARTTFSDPAWTWRR